MMSTNRPKPDIADRVGGLEPEDDIGEIHLAPRQLGCQRGLEDAEHLPVDIVDDRGSEEQADDYPAVIADARRSAPDRGIPGFRHSLPPFARLYSGRAATSSHATDRPSPKRASTVWPG